MHWWNGPEHPLGAPFTLSPENYSYWWTPAPGRDNFYLGYSLEKTCLQTPYVPFDSRPRQAYIFGKFMSYFVHKDYILPSNTDNKYDQITKADFYTETSRKANVTFLGQFQRDLGMKKGPPPGITEVPRMERPAFQNMVARSRVVLGLGSPLLSPTPWEALCLGVPFINPIYGWDRNRPDDRTKWWAQQDGLLYLGLDEPYVYHVKVGDREGFERAVTKALDTPIERFIPPHMRMDALVERIRILLETDWTETAKRIVAERRKEFTH